MKNSKKHSHIAFQCSVFNVRRDNYFISKTNNTHDFFIIEPTNWVNVIALTDKQEIVLVKQYRYGTQTTTLEIPGGMIDEGELPQIAAQRELLEETGYEAKVWQMIGTTDPNPAIQNNKCYTFFAKDAYFTKLPELDSTEEIEVITKPFSLIPEMIQQGQITHSLVITAFYHYNLCQKNKFI